MKLCVVGGGSTYTPELVDGIARLRDTLPVEELVLVDPDERRLALVGGFSRRLFARYGHPGVIRTTRVLDEGVEETFPASDPVAIQHIGSQVDRPAPDQVRQKLARRQLRALIDRHTHP